MFVLPIVHCVACFWEWTPRKANAVLCPRCKRRSTAREGKAPPVSQRKGNHKVAA